MGKNKDIFFGPSVNGDMARLDAARARFRDKNGVYDPAAWLEFAVQFNAYMNHARRPFTPITGDNFKL